MSQRRHSVHRPSASNAVSVRCATCTTRAPIAADGRFVEHPAPGGARCGMSGQYPTYAFCGRDAPCPTLSPDVRVCGACDVAVWRRDSIQRCPNPKCTRGRVLCPRHSADVRISHVCRVCGVYDGAQTCATCDGAGVIYLRREPEEVVS